MEIDPESPDWPYRQAATTLRRRIVSGELGPKLPSHMDLAQQLGIAPRTVQRALKILMDDGLVYAVAGRGTFVVNRKD